MKTKRSGLTVVALLLAAILAVLVWIALSVPKPETEPKGGWKDIEGLRYYADTQGSYISGWMTIDGTPIHYPVMQSPDRVDFYLDHNFDRAKNGHGCLYVRESCDVFAPSDNLTIYGHHMRNGTMFARLDNYLKKDFYEKYPSIRFDTLYERHTYTIFAVFTTTASVGRGFAYHLFEDAADEADFQDFVSTCKSLSLYETGITPVYGDKMISLSTCEYSQDNGRLVVVAVRD